MSRKLRTIPFVTMDLVAALILSTVVVTVTVSDDQNIQVALQAENSKAIGSEDFQYYSVEGKEAADIILKYHDVDDSLKDYVRKLKNENDAAIALEEYVTNLESIAGTECDQTCGETDDFYGALVNIQVIVETCAAAAPKDDRDALEKVVTKQMAKIQAADTQLLKNAELCTSLRTDPPVSCDEERTKQLNIIKSCVSYKSLAQITYYYRNAFFNTIANIDSCVSEGTKDLKDNLEERNIKIKECKESLN